MKADQQEVKSRKLKITPVKRKLSEKEINDIAMNTLKSNKKGSFGALNEECRLWQELGNNPPQWWKNILEDKELYVEIRKDNYANVYYHGGNVTKVQWTGGEITAETHQKYLGDKKPVRIAITKKDKEIKIYEYRDCREKLQTKEGLEKMKRCIHGIYHDLHGENEHAETRVTRDRSKHVYTSSEKSVQGALKLRFPARFIDSEFAYRIGKNSLIRFDLVELKGNELIFIEIKLITDSRLNSNEIINQMTKYSCFIREHAEVLKDYYTKLLRIKKRIGLWNGETEIKHVALKPVLLVVNTYKGELSKGREERKEAIGKLKNKEMFETIIIDYPDLCK